jgi:hypothetical protein
MDALERQGSAIFLRYLFRHLQVWGVLTLLVGALLLWVLPPAPPEMPIDLHPMAKVFLGLGAAQVVLGTLFRWLNRK